MEGIPIRTTLDHEKTIQHSALITQLTAKAKKDIRQLDTRYRKTFYQLSLGKRKLISNLMRLFLRKQAATIQR